MIHFNVRRRILNTAVVQWVQDTEIRNKKKQASSNTRGYWHLFTVVFAMVMMLGTVNLQAQDCNAEISVPLDQIGTSIFGNGTQLPQSPNCTCASGDEPACVLVKITSVPDNIDEMGCTLVIDPKQGSTVGFTYNAMDLSCGMIDINADELRIPISSSTAGIFEFFLCKPGSGLGASGVELDDVYLESCCEAPDPTISGDADVCAGKQIRYEVDATTTTDFPEIEYDWTISSSGTVISGGGADDDFVEVVWSAGGTVTVEATNLLYGGCSGTDTQTVTVNELPNVDAGNYVSQFTISHPITLLGTPNNTTGGVWTGLGISDNNDGSASFDPSIAGAGSIVVTYTYTTAEGCFGSDTATILVTDLDDLDPTYLGCGDDFYDTGGPDRRYTDEPTVTIICPDNPAQAVVVDFQNMDISWDDMLKVFDGDSADAPQIDPGSGMGQGVDVAPNGGIVSASCNNMSGCLTFVFCVDDSGFGSGWHALIECEDREGTDFDCEDLSNMYKRVECGEETVTLDIPIPYHSICGAVRDVRITASCSDYVDGIPAGGTVTADGEGTLPLTFPLGIHTLTFTSTMIDHEDFECSIQIRVTASHLACKQDPVITTWDHCYAYITPDAVLEEDCVYDNDNDVQFTYEIEVEGVEILEYTEEGHYPLIDITNVDCGSTYKVIVTRSYVLDWNCNGDASDDQPLTDECETFITIADYVTPIIENGPPVVEIPCYDDPGEQAIFAIGNSGGQVEGGLSGGIYLIPGIDDIEVTDNCEYDLIIGDWEYEVANCTTEPLDTEARVFHYYQRKIVAVDQCGNRHTFKQRVAIVQPTIYPPIEVLIADCTDDLNHLSLVQAWYDWVAEGRPADDPRADYAVYVPNFDPTPNANGTTDASGDEIPVAPNDALNDFPNCGYNVTFEDTEDEAGCAGSRSFWRNWEVFNWCQNGMADMADHHQLVNVGDGYPPSFVGDPMFVFTPYADDVNCKGEITFWHPNVEDACGGNVFATVIYNGVEKSFVGGPVTFHNVMAGTTITVTFTATDECEDVAEMDFDVEITGAGEPNIVCPGIQSVYLNEDCEAVLQAYGLGLESTAPCGSLIYDIALETDDSDGDGYPEEEDYDSQIVFTDADLVNCQQTGITVILRFTDQDGNYYYCDVEVWLKSNGDEPEINCEDINPYIVYSWDVMADDLARVGDSSDPLAGFQRLMDSGDLGTNVWESTGCLGNTWVEIIDVDYDEFHGRCPGGRICYKFRIRNECGFISDVCTNCVIVNGDVDWTMNFPADEMVEDGMVPNPVGIDDIVHDNNGSWELEVVVETVNIGECSRKLVYNYYLTNTCTWDDRDQCAANVDRPEGMTDGVVLRYQSDGTSGNSIDDGNEALDNDGFDVTTRGDDADFVSLPPNCTPRNASVYNETSNITGNAVRCVSAHQYGYIHYQQMIVIDNGGSSIPIIQVLNLGPFCDTDLEQNDDGYCLVPVEISACIEFGCNEGALDDFRVMLKPFGEGNGIADPYGTLVLLDEKTCAIQGHYPLDPERAETQHILIVTDGHYQFEIPFVVEDCTPAVIRLEDIGPFCGGDITNAYGGCSAEVDIRASFDFGCGYKDIHDYVIKLKPFGEGPAITDPYGEVLYIDDTHLAVQGAYPLDPNNHITEHVLVICGDDDVVVELPFKVKDCTPPTIPDCYDYIVEGEKLVHLTAKQLDNGSHDLCTDYNDLNFFFADPLEHPDSTECTFTCEDGENGVIPYTLWVVDEWGNSAYCNGTIIIQDYDCEDENEGAGAAAIGGNISTEDGDMVEAVEVNLRGGMSMDMVTTTEGHFMFEELPMNESYTARPYRNDKPINGVTTYDLVFMSRHILGSRLFTSPYDMIAADINNSGSITTFDLVLLRKLILGETEEFNGNTSWRFIPKSHVFSDPTNPWADPIPEQVEINPLAEDRMENDFIAVKVGDVNGSASTNNFQNTEDRSTGLVFFQTEEKDLKKGESYRIPFYLEAGTALVGYQFSLQYDLDALELVGIESGVVSEEHFGMKYATEGIITSSWNGTAAATLDEKAPMFYATFRTKSNTTLSSALRINSSRLAAEAYTQADEQFAVQLDFGSKTSDRLKVYQNIPNPFSDYTVLSFFLPEASEVVVEILNTSGQLIKRFDYQLAKGKHELNVDLSGLPQEGLFYYQLSSNKEVATGKMVRIQE